MKPEATLAIRLPHSAIRHFRSLFSTGVGIETETGTALVAFLCDQLGIEREYLRNRVQTVFVNGRAADRLDEIRLGPGDIIALSAAMPGLAGATLRKGGLLAGFRQAITHPGAVGQDGAGRKTVVILKLFNLVAAELSAEFLRAGVWVQGRDLSATLRKTDLQALAGAMTLCLNGVALAFRHNAVPTLPEGWILLKVDDAA